MAIERGAEMLAAAGIGKRREVERLLKADPGLAQVRGTHEETPLHGAAWGGYKEIVLLLLEAGADVDAHNKEGRTPLCHMVAWCTRTDVVALLLEHGADLNARDASGNTALSLAAGCIRKPGHCWGDHEKLVRFLREHGAEVDLVTAALLDLPEAAEALLQKEPEAVQARDRIAAHDRRGWQVADGATPLHRAADRGSLATARLLLGRAADPNATDSRGRTPLTLAAHDAGTRKPGPTPEMVELLLMHGAVLDLHACALLGRDAEVTRWLNTPGVQVDARDAGGNAPLHLAAWNGKIDTVRLLLSHGADSNSSNRRSETPLSVAKSYGHDAVIELLLARGATCTFHEAVVMNRPDLVDAILAVDPAAIDRPNRRGRTPLRVAVEAELFGNSSMREIAEYLLSHGAAMDLWTAATWGRAEELARLLDRDASGIDAFDNTVTPLHCAAQQGQREAVQVLVERGAALDPVANDLATPTIWALWSGHKEVARYLVEQGANVDALDNWSDTPWIASALG